MAAAAPTLGASSSDTREIKNIEIVLALHGDMFTMNKLIRMRLKRYLDVWEKQWADRVSIDYKVKRKASIVPSVIRPSSCSIKVRSYTKVVPDYAISSGALSVLDPDMYRILVTDINYGHVGDHSDAVIDPVLKRVAQYLDNRYFTQVITTANIEAERVAELNARVKDKCGIDRSTFVLKSGPAIAQTIVDNLKRLLDVKSDDDEAVFLAGASSTTASAAFSARSVSAGYRQHDCVGSKKTVETVDDSDTCCCPWL